MTARLLASFGGAPDVLGNVKAALRLFRLVAFVLDHLEMQIAFTIATLKLARASSKVHVMRSGRFLCTLNVSEDEHNLVSNSTSVSAPVAALKNQPPNGINKSSDGNGADGGISEGELLLQVGWIHPSPYV